MKRILCSVLSVLFVVMIPVEVFAQVYEPQEPEKQSYVIMTDNEHMAEKLENSYSAEKIAESDNIFSADLTENQAEHLENSSKINFVEEDILFTGCEADSKYVDNQYNQWYLEAIGADGEKENIQSEIKIELLDSGVDYSNELSIKDNVNLIDEDLNESPVFIDSTGHGTAIASVICAKNDGKGIDGINPNISLYSVKILDSNNQSTLSRVVEGIYWGIDNDMDIINMSFGTNYDSQILRNAVEAAYEAGILMIAAAGNTHHQQVQYPAAYNRVVAVGAVSPQGELAEITSAGTQLDILAPGEEIAAIDFLDTISSVSGTSIAAAQVTGIASLIWAKDKSKTNDFIKSLLCSAVNRPETLTQTQAGIVDYTAALNAYDEFESVYVPSQTITECFEICNDFDYSNEAEPIVNALWGNSSEKQGHYELAGSASFYAGYDETDLQVIRYACIHLDGINSQLNNHKAFGPHGTGNYVLNLKFLYFVSNYIYTNGEKFLILKIDEFTQEHLSAWNVSWHKEDTEFDKKRFEDIKHQIIEFIEHKQLLYPIVKENYENYSKEERNRYLGLMIFGMALHLAGDIYAHRAIVPKYTVAGTNSTAIKTNSEGQTMFGTMHFNKASSFLNNSTDVKNIKLFCLADGITKNVEENVTDELFNTLKYWQYMQRGVSLQVVEFRDINMFLMDSYQGSKNPYEDNASFCNERYKAAMLSCKRIAKRFKEGGTFYTKLIYPKYYNSTAEQNAPFKTVKLNNFKNYASVSNLALIGADLTDDDWKINSTTTLV